MRQILMHLAGICVVSCFFSGCSGSSLPGRVNGVVTLDGAALPEATITFFQVDENGQPIGRPSIASTDSSGRYVLQYSTSKSGIEPGTYKVSISTFRAESLDNEEKVIPRVEEKVPAKYNTKSELKQEIPKGTTVLNFDLKSSDGPIVQPDGK
jgi:hypothetical protein